MHEEDFAILRTSKIKSVDQIRLAGEHLTRARSTLNANPNRTKFNRVLLGSSDPVAAFKKRIAEHGITTLRKNGVLAVELLLAFSPKWLSNNDRTISAKRLSGWCNTCTDWLKTRYGANILSCVIHFDESSPHIHAIVVPLTEKFNKKSGRIKASLSARDMIGGSAKLIELQDSYANAVSHLGLKRGIKGSKATHTEVKDFYKFVAEGNRLAQKLHIEGPSSDPQLAAGWLQTLHSIEKQLEDKDITKFFTLMDSLRTQNKKFRTPEPVPKIKPVRPRI